MAKKSREKFKVYGNVFDEFTNRNLFKLISEGVFDGLESPISIGKEANIFTAKKGNKKLIVKIYRLHTCDFNVMYDYIKYDPRYLGLRKRRREIIFAWAQREFRNLMKSREAGIKVPTPIIARHHIIVEEYIGDKKPAPKLKDAQISDPDKLFKDVIKSIKKLYSAKLVHADLSSFNILYHKNAPVFIDFSQCTTTENPNADDYLIRDIKNICQFFKKHGINKDPEEIIKKIKKKG